MALLRCLLGCRNQCNTKKLGFLSSHLIRHHHHPIPSSWSFFTTTTTLPAEGSPDEHHSRGIHTSIVNWCPEVDSTTMDDCVETLGGFREKGDAEINPRVTALAQFAAFAIGDAQNLSVWFERVVSAKVQLVNNGRLYYITMEAKDGVARKLYEVHILDTLIERNSVSLKDWCVRAQVWPPPPHSSTQQHS